MLQTKPCLVRIAGYWLLILAAAIGMGDQSGRWTACLYRHARDHYTSYVTQWLCSRQFAS